MTYEKTLRLDKALRDKIYDYVHGHADHWQPESEPIRETVTFPDGMQMDMKCVGDGQGTSWIEFMLVSRDGGQLAVTDPDDYFMGSWELEHDGVKYVMHVLPTPEPPEDPVVTQEDIYLPADTVAQAERHLRPKDVTDFQGDGLLTVAEFTFPVTGNIMRVVMQGSERHPSVVNAVLASPDGKLLGVAQSKTWLLGTWVIQAGNVSHRLNLFPEVERTACDAF